MCDVKRSNDPSVLYDVHDLVPDDAIGFSPGDLMAKGFCLVYGEDVAYFEEGRVLQGHYFFRSRGKEAERVARLMLSVIFESYSIVTGLTPKDNLGALWMTRRLGFKQITELETDVGVMVLSMLTKKDFE